MEAPTTRRSWQRADAHRGFFGIGIWHGKCEGNIGSLWRTAHILGADFLFTVGARYEPQATDTTAAWKSLPLWSFETVDQLVRIAPANTPIVGIELDDRARALPRFTHPERAIYLLGAEDHGLPSYIREQCDALVQLPGDMSMNVAVAGSIVLYDRVTRGVK